MFTTAPEQIEQSDFGAGWNPDQETPTADPSSLRDMLNLVPELGGTGALVSRKGFRRIRQELDGGLTGHWVVAMHRFRGNGTTYIIVVMTNNLSAANNVRIYAVNMETWGVTRINTAGVTWNNPDSYHWGIGIDEVYYGGSQGNNMYSWNPATSTWTANASVNTNWKTATDNQNDSVTIATQYGRDFAYRGKEIVTYSGKQYMPTEGIRHDTWDSDSETRYKRGDKVSRKAIWGSTVSYWKSFECIKAHHPNTLGSTSYPGTGATWTTYWKKVRLPLPVNADNETSDKWYFVPTAAKTPVATWHADRLWMRYDGQGDKSRVLYSSPVQPEKHMDIPDITWDPTDFAPGNDIHGPGGGWIPFNDGKHGGVIEALHSYGQYLLVFKRRAVWVVSGASEETFSVRRLARGVGAVGPRAVTELDGLVYFLSDEGLHVTDGTAVQQVEGFEKFNGTIEARIDLMATDTSTPMQPHVINFDDRIWVSLPCTVAASGEKYWTLVYEPRSGGIYKTDLPVASMASIRHTAIPHLWFAPPDGYGTNNDYVMQYDHATSGYLDDTAASVYAGATISWQATTAWWAFGLMRQQRRIRRTWAVVKSAASVTLRTYRDWVTTQVTSKSQTPSPTTSAVQLEGEWIPDSHAVSFKVSGTGAATLYGVAVATEHRRTRYHVT